MSLFINSKQTISNLSFHTIYIIRPKTLNNFKLNQFKNILNFSTNIVLKNKLFTPINFSFSKLSSYYNQNLSLLIDNIKNKNFKNTIIHYNSISAFQNSFNLIPKSGSFVHFESNIIENNNHENNFGIVLNDLKFSLSKYSIYKILLPNGKIIEIDSNQILFTIPEFIDRNLMKNLLINNDNNNQTLSIETISHLTYTINVFLLYFTKISNLMLLKDLIRTLYLKDSFLNYQSSLNLLDFSQKLYNISTSLKNNLNIKSNPFGIHALLLSSHFLIYNDPIHFRFLKSNKLPIFNILNPLNQLTTKYFKNPILLSENLENIFNQPNNLIIKSYSSILKKSNEFQIYNILKNDENFKRLILLIKYSIIYSNNKILFKLSKILPIDKINSQNLYNFLINIGIYDNNSNPLLSSGIYGLNMNDPTDLSLIIKDINELQYSLNKGLPIEKLPKRLQRYQPLKNLGNNIENIENNENNEKNEKNENSKSNNKILNKNYSDLLIKIIQDSKSKIWPRIKSKNKRTLYKLTETIAFSVDQESLTNYKFNIFIPFPNQSPNENITIQEPIQIENNLTTFPKLKKFNHSLRINQPCIKLSFNHNLIDSESLTSPIIKVGLDIFKKIEIVDEEWFYNRNAVNLKGLKKMNCWLSLNKLLNLLVEKEKTRIKFGYLKMNNENGGFMNKDNENDKNDENDLIRDKKWIIKNLKLLIDESLSRFCLDKNINIINRNMLEGISNSLDYRVFKKFKIFKWYANSYDSFSFQLSSNPDDITAFVGCLSFLSDSKYYFGKNNGNNEYLPLGVKYYSSFTSLNYIETHLNQWQLFRYLLIESFEIIKNDNNNNNDNKIQWDPNKLEKVTNEHFNKCLSQSEGYIELKNRMKRFKILEKIKKDISDGTNNNNFTKYSLMRCVVTKICKNKIIGYLCDFDIEVEIEIDLQENIPNNNLTIGDRLICSQIIKVDPFEDILIIK